MILACCDSGVPGRQRASAGAGAEDGAGVLFGLQQAGDDERLVPAQDRGLGFNAGPLLEPAVPALPLAPLQVIPQAGQGAAGVQLGYRVEAGREVLGGRPLPRLDLALACWGFRGFLPTGTPFGPLVLSPLQWQDLVLVPVIGVVAGFIGLRLYERLLHRRKAG